MTRNEFFNAIKSGKLSGAYILHGDEEFIKNSALSQVKALIDPALADLNIDSFASAVSETVIPACETLPFMSELRIVIVRELPTESEASKFISYIGHMAPSTLLLFVVKGQADGRLSFVKAMGNRSVNFDPLNEFDAARWLKQQSRIRNVTLSDRDASFFVAVSGTSCLNLNNEFKKAAAYVGEGGTVTADVISKVVTKDLDFVVFSILDHLLAGRVRDGFTSLKHNIDDGLKPIDIASALSEKARLILQARLLLDKKIPKNTVIEQLGVSRGYAYRTVEDARLLRADMIKPLEKCARLLCDAVSLPLSGGGDAYELLCNALLSLVPDRRSARP